MDPVKQPMNRSELIEFANSLSSEIAILRRAIAQLSARVKEAEALNDSQQETIRNLTEERLIGLYANGEL